MVKQFMAFGYDNYDASGGMFDFIGDFDTIEEAVSKIEEGSTLTAGDIAYHFSHDKGHILNTVTMEFVAHYASKKKYDATQVIGYEHEWAYPEVELTPNG